MIVPTPKSTQPPLRNRNQDPYLACNFRLEIAGLDVGGFTEVTGLQCEVEIKDYREGGQNQFIHRLAGPVRFPSNLLLKHGLLDGKQGAELWNWYKQVMAGKIDRHNVSVILLNDIGQEVRRWEFAEAYPVRWSGPELRANTAAIAIETLELVHQGFVPTKNEANKT